MSNLILLLLGVDYLKKRANALSGLGWLSFAAGLFIFVDALDGVLYFPLTFFAVLFVVEGMATLAVAQSGVGGQRVLRYIKGLFVLVAGAMILMSQKHGHFVLSMTFGLLFLVDGLLQCIAAHVVRFHRWRSVLVAGVVEIGIAIFFFQPYPTHYVGTVPFCLGLFLMISGFHLLVLARRVRRLEANPGFADNPRPGFMPTQAVAPLPLHFEGPPDDTEHALTVHVWTPTGSAKARTRYYPLVDRYVAAVDMNGVISTGHAALETPEGVYISLYPAQEIDRSPEQFGRLLRATADNDVPGVFQPDYATESQAWCPSTNRVRIRNYDVAKLAAFWRAYRQNSTYNLTHRNCSSSVTLALESALEGAVGRLHGPKAGWWVMVRLLITPELWVAALIRKRALTMAWTPGLALDYSRAMSMLADPRPFGWWGVLQWALRKRTQLRSNWRQEGRSMGS